MRIFLMFALSCLLMFSAAPDSSAQSLFSQASGSQDDGNAELSETLRLAAENGATAKQLMAIFGWSDMKHAEQYAKEARRKKLAGDSIHTINLKGVS